MNEKTLLSITFSLLITCSVNADELVPATSEDVSDFERIVTNQAILEAKALHPRADQATKAPPKETSKIRKENFGSLVSIEAKRLNDESGDRKKDMGKWVSEQRRRDSGLSLNSPGPGHRGSSSGGEDLGAPGTSASAETRSAVRGRKSSARDSGTGKHGRSGK